MSYFRTFWDHVWWKAYVATCDFQIVKILTGSPSMLEMLIALFKRLDLCMTVAKFLVFVMVMLLGNVPDFVSHVTSYAVCLVQCWVVENAKMHAEKALTWTLLLSSSSSSVYPALSLEFTFFGEIFVNVTVFNPTIEIVTFRLCGWCMLGVFLLPAFTCLGHECQDLLSLCNGMHVCTD